MFYRFGYETEFYPGLSRLPLHVRMKLDLTGIKISLKDWLAFMNSSLWDPLEVPHPVLQKSVGMYPAVTLAEWTRWQDHERYALYKTAVSKSQPEVFESILNELRSAKNCAQN